MMSYQLMIVPNRFDAVLLRLIPGGKSRGMRKPPASLLKIKTTS